MVLFRKLLVLALALAATTTGCATAGRTPTDPGPAVIDAQLGRQRVRVSLDALADRVQLADGSDFRAELVGRDEHQSHHVVAIRTGEVPHRHDEHDLLVILLRGHGEILIGLETQPVGAGSILYIPRHTRHAFTNRSDQPAIAYTVYTPAFDGKDRVDAE